MVDISKRRIIQHKYMWIARFFFSLPLFFQLKIDIDFFLRSIRNTHTQRNRQRQARECALFLHNTMYDQDYCRNIDVSSVWCVVVAVFCVFRIRFFPLFFWSCCWRIFSRWYFFFVSAFCTMCMAWCMILVGMGLRCECESLVYTVAIAHDIAERMLNK